ncbi:hypothetical protein F5X99DRAFT_383949 [Biscogniauxia marginata]|nr:hypothetical protein F5X99DRAFT_383949 [Biscogniauxia marginata]
MTTDIKVLAALPLYGVCKPQFHVRLLVDGTTIKYATVDKDTFDRRWYADDKVDTIVFPELPTGDWTWAWISKDPESGLPSVTGHIKQPQVRGVSNVWHDTRIEYLDLEKIQVIHVEKRGCNRREDRMNLVKHPLFDGPVLMKIAEIPSHMRSVESDTAAYKAIEGTGIGPKFLGHVTEGGRVMGFLVEWIEGAREARAEDKEACIAALEKLHERGVAHRDAHQGNFLIKDDRVYIIDFEDSKICNDEELFFRDIDFVRRWDPSLDRSQPFIPQPTASDDESSDWDARKSTRKSTRRRTRREMTRKRALMKKFRWLSISDWE